MIRQTARALPHGVTLSCRELGPPGQPAVVLLHGFPEAAFVWDDVANRLAQAAGDGWHIVAPNLRGYERSSAPPDASAYRARHLVQDIAALIEQLGAPLTGLVAHDWGGAIAWNLANQRPELLRRLVIINSPHPGTFLRELRHSAAQRAASEYMNLLAAPDAEARLAADDFALLWSFFADARGEPPIWLDESQRAQYRALWRGDGSRPGAGLTGGCHYYRASPLRPPTSTEPGASALELPDNMLTIPLPTRVIWGLDDRALLPGLIEGLERWVPQLDVMRVAGASHWLVHEQPGRVADSIAQWLL